MDAANTEPSVIIKIRVSTSSDDAEERASGSVKLKSSDLELVFDKSDQTVGMRFNGVDIPQGATILNAFVQFEVNEPNAVATSLTIQGEDADDATTFIASNGNITSRPRTMAAVPWYPVEWPTKHVAGVDQQTPDIASVIQEIVDRPGWSPSNSLVVIISGTGERTAESFDGSQSAAGRVTGRDVITNAALTAMIQRRLQAANVRAKTRVPCIRHATEARPRSYHQTIRLSAPPSR